MLNQAALLEGFSHLNVCTDGYVDLYDYTKAVEITLAALKKTGDIIDLSLPIGESEYLLTGVSFCKPVPDAWRLLIHVQKT